MQQKVLEASRIIIIDLLYLGDLIFATPFIKNLRQNLPDKRIDMLVNSNFYGLMKNSPELDNVYSYNKNWSWRRGISFARELAKNNYDLGLNIHGNWRTAILLKLINPAYSVGYGGKGRGIFLNQELDRPGEIHMVEAYLNFLEEIGLKRLNGNRPGIIVSVEASRRMRKLLADEGISTADRLVALNIGGTWPTKRWPVTSFAELADSLIVNCGVKLIVTGSKADLPRVKEMVSLMKKRPLIFTGQTSLEELVALLECCQLVISNDSGPVHVADAVGTPTITIFGPSDEVKYRPSGDKSRVVTAAIDCRPCGEHDCPLGHHRCMKDIEVNDIVKIIDESELL